MGGIVGRLLHEFAVTIILAILFSGIISVTLTPMLCARILRDEHGQKHNAFYRWSENTFNSMQDAYNRSLTWSLNHRRVILGSVRRQSVLVSGGLFSIMQQDFLPSDDTGQADRADPGRQRHLARPDVQISGQVARVINADPNVEGVFGQMSGRQRHRRSQSGFLNIIVLKPLSEAQAFRRPDHPRAQAQAQPLPRHQCLPHQSAHHPHRRPRRRAPATNTRMQGLDLGELQDVSDRLMTQHEDDVRLRRRQFRPRRGDAGGAGQDRPRPRRRLGRDRRSRSKPRWARPSAASRFPRSTPRPTSIR